MSVDTLNDLPKLNTLPFSGKLRLDMECAGGQSDEQFYPEARGLLGMTSLLSGLCVNLFLPWPWLPVEKMAGALAATVTP